MSNNWKLDIDVHVAVGDDGKMMLVVGGLVRPLSGEELETVLTGKSKPRRKRVSGPSVVVVRGGNDEGETSVKTPEWRSKKHKAGICIWCEHRAMPRKKVCRKHYQELSARIAKARKKARGGS